MKIFISTIIFSMAILTSVAQTINTEKSKVSFKIGNMKFRTVEGNIKGMSGIVNFNESNIADANFDICIDPKTIDTENEERDTHLKDPDFFDVAKYPSICFVSKSIVKSGEKYVVTGDVTIYNTTNEEQITFTKNDNVLTGNMNINRFDYNLGVEEYDGTFMVGETVEIEITCVLE